MYQKTNSHRMCSWENQIDWYINLYKWQRTFNFQPVVWVFSCFGCWLLQKKWEHFFWKMFVRKKYIWTNQHTNGNRNSNKINRNIKCYERCGLRLWMHSHHINFGEIFQTISHESRTLILLIWFLLPSNPYRILYWQNWMRRMCSLNACICESLPRLE